MVSWQSLTEAEFTVVTVCVQVVWVPLQKKADVGVLSACSGGKVLLWRLDAAQHVLVLNAAFSLEPHQLPPSLKVIPDPD